MNSHQETAVSPEAHGFKGWVAHRMAGSHLAGPDISDAVEICGQASVRGWSTTLGYWNDPSHDPKTNACMYQSALKAIINYSLNSYLSVKVTAIEYDRGLLTDLLDRAAQAGVRIHFDAMDPDSSSRTFELLEFALPSHRNLGCTLPSRWKRSIDDVRRVVDYGIPVRVVKGQWVDPNNPRLNPRQNFLEIVRRFSGTKTDVAVATHDRPLAKKALQYLKECGTVCEMEQMSSLPQNCARLARSLGIPVRIYIPYGFPTLPYDIWQAKARPGIISWAMRDFLLGKHRPLTSIF